jgi:hypothetical protein
MRRAFAWLTLPALALILLVVAPPAGCSSTPPPPPACTTRCPICPGADEVCAGASGTVDFNAQCLPSCTTSTDCGLGGHCVDIVGDTTEVCVSIAAPVLCSLVDGGFNCDPGPAACLDAMTLLSPFASPLNHVCGLERIACPVACVAAGAGDGGVGDMGAAAHCQ